MNRIFRIVWSRALRAWVVASELATSHGRSSRRRVERRAGPCKADRAVDARSASRWRLRLGAFAALLATYAPAQAVDRYWDTNNTAVGSGGTGAWNTTSSFWSPNSDGVSGPYSAWNNAALDDAIFSGAAGTLTLGGPITAHNLTFGSNGYILNGSTLTLAGATPTIFQNSGGTTINSIIAGTSGLTKAGGGNLALNGVNTFSGGITLNQGALSVNGDAALGDAGNDIVAANGTTLVSTGALAASRDVTITSGVLGLGGAGVGSAHFTGAGGVNVNNGVRMSNDANDYLGRTAFTSGSESFTSIADLGVASSLGAPTTVVNGTISVSSGGGVPTFVNYLGDGDSSNRNWNIFAAGSPAPVVISNQGTGTLTLTGNFNLGGAGLGAAVFRANTADIALLGVLSGAPDPVAYQGTGAARTITLGGANTYTNTTGISNVTVRASVLADTGVASSLGAAASAIGVSSNGVLSYTGTGGSSNRPWALNNGTISNDGSGALALSGNMTLTNTGTLGGSFAGGNNGFSGTISGTGHLAKTGASTWIVDGTNTYTGNTIVNGGTLVAGSAQAFGAMNAAVVNGGTLDLNGFSMTFPSLSGTGGSVDLDSATLTLDGTSAVNTSYAGSITGTGGLTKQGASTQTLSGTNTYTGATTVNGGTLRLNFGVGGAPASNIIASASTLNMGGGTLNVAGANGLANTQTFNGLNLFVVGSYDKSVDGSNFEQHQANLGVRIKW